MAWTIELTRVTERQMEKLDKPVAAQIARHLLERLATHSPVHRRDYGASAWDYRIICEIRDAGVVVLALGIGHRKEIYH